MHKSLTRREAIRQAIASSTLVSTGLLANPLTDRSDGNETLTSKPFSLRYLLGSCMFGTTKLAEILPYITETGAKAIDLWPKPHGDQREQLDEMGEEACAELLRQHNVTIGCITRYDLGPFGLRKEMRLAGRLGCRTLVTGGKGPANATGGELKSAITSFVERMKPHLDMALETGVTIAIENHANNLIHSPDSLKWLIDLCPNENLAIALAPYHLPQKTGLIHRLIHDLGERLAVFYAWQHGLGCMEKLPKDQELLQMPGRGDLDFAPLLAALRDIDYRGWTEIFMHPVPRGIPILESTPAVVDEINRARAYLGRIVKELQ